ncbi:MAG: alpha-glucuronidase, partial [Prevotella sp.]|nr:alpha-glucuronidase [Prevotella sp.]
MKKYLIISVVILFAISLSAEDGSKLWLRMPDGANSLVYTNTKSKTVDIAVNELKEYWHGSPVYLKIDDSLPHNDGYRISFGG